MKKRLLCIAFALLLLGGNVLHTGALEFVFYNIYIGGKVVTSFNADDVFGDGTVSFDADTSTLTLSNAYIHGTQLQEADMSMGIYAYERDLNIVLDGDNVVIDTGGFEFGAGVQVYNGNLTISGLTENSSLSISSGDNRRTSYGICVYSSKDIGESGVLTIKDTTVSVDCGIAGFSGVQHCVGIEANFLDLQGAVLTAQSGSSQTSRTTGIYLEGGLRLTDSTLDSKCDISTSSYGLYVEGNADINNSRVTVSGSKGVVSYGVAVTEGTSVNGTTGEVTPFDGGTLTVDGKSHMIVRGGPGETNAVGIYTEKDLIIKDGKVEIFSSEAIPSTSSVELSFSYGVYSEGKMRLEGGDVTVSGGDAYNAYGIYSTKGVDLISGKLSATSGKGYYSCGICAPVIDVSGGNTTVVSTGTGHYSYGTYAQQQDAQTGVMRVSGDARLVSRAGEAEYYSDGIVTDVLFDVSGGSVNAYGGNIRETSYSLGYPPDSSGVWSYGKINISGGVINAYAKKINYERGRSIGLSGDGGVYISSGIIVKGTKETFANGDKKLIPSDTDLPVVIIGGEIPFVTGDVNSDGDINIKDATAIQKHIALLSVFDKEAEKAADYDGDGEITIKDATAIQKFIAGIF